MTNRSVVRHSVRMEQWRAAASQQVQVLSGRVTDLLSRGLGLLRSELGVDLGLEPELIPPWLILLAACGGLLLVLGLWASACRAILKKRPALSPSDDGDEVKRVSGKPLKSEEPRRKKKKAEKVRTWCFLEHICRRAVAGASCHANATVTVGASSVSSRMGMGNEGQTPPSEGSNVEFHILSLRHMTENILAPPSLPLLG